LKWILLFRVGVFQGLVLVNIFSTRSVEAICAAHWNHLIRFAMWTSQKAMTFQRFAAKRSLDPVWLSCG
jgi:hypothetical protein